MKINPTAGFLVVLAAWACIYVVGAIALVIASAALVLWLSHHIR